MNRILLFFIILTFVSCDYFNVKKTTSRAILEEELKTFSWNDVDVYPAFTTCDSSLIKAKKKSCFELTLSTHILENLQKERIIVSQDIKDIIMVSFEISNQGLLDLKEIKVNELTKLEIPDIEIIIKESLEGLPQIYPAIKRGQQVKTSFKLPLKMSVN